MLGRLPLKYRVAIWVAGLVSCAGLGVWVALMTPVPLVWTSGAVVGTVLGALAVAAYLNVLERGSGHRRPADPHR